MVRNREQILLAFCKATTLEEMTRIATDCLDTMQAMDQTEAFARAESARLKQQVARQAKIIDDLTNALRR
jgi:hypothetical protein